MQLPPVVSVPVSLSALIALAAACASTPVAAQAPVAPSAPVASPSVTQVAPPPSSGEGLLAATSPSASATVSPANAPPPNAKEAAADGSCPTGMVMVEGDYCTEVDHKCLIEWYAPQNKKVICEQFEPKATCVGAKVHKRYCIDKYEWPNQKGVRPEVMNTFYQAQVKCAARGMRMCSETEWNFACEGPDMKPFPYGFTRDPAKCNGDHQWDGPDMKKVAKRDGKELARLWKGVPSGTEGCVSDFGVEDMPGNADEVCAGEMPKAKFAAVNTGGPWYSGVRNQCRPKVYTHAEDFYYYYLSFRCCANPDGKPNEPRTAKQIKDGTSWKEVERLAGFTTEQMKQALALKKEGRCTCKNNKLEGVSLHKSPPYLCDTMCGTLLAPGAVDGSDETRVPHKERQKIH
jgi:sulfatase modifying factor 1